jgi:hypothetical protein
MFSCFAFRRYRGRQVPFSSFALPESFPAVPRSSGLIFKFCSPGLVFGSTAGIMSHFYFLHARTRFRRYRWRRVPFSYFARPDSFSAVSRSSGPVFKFCIPKLIFCCGTKGVGSRFRVLRVKALFRRYRGHRHSFSCFELPDSLSTIPRTSASVFMFYASGLIFVGTEGVRSCFHIYRSRTCFRRCRVRRVTFSCFAPPDSFPRYRGRRVPFSSFAC